MAPKFYASKSAQILKNRSLLNVQGAVSSEETFRGLLTSIGTGSIVTILIYIGLYVFKMSVNNAAFIFNVLIGTIVAYSSDIIFAKKFFNLPSYGGKKYDPESSSIEVPYNDFKTRLSWWISSFKGKYFTKFLTVSIIDSSIYLVLLDFIKGYLDKKDINFKFRDLLIVMLLPALTFFLYVNQLRFRWAYDPADKPLMNILILVWLTVVFILNLIYFRFNPNDQEKVDGEENIETEDELNNNNNSNNNNNNSNNNSNNDIDVNKLIKRIDNLHNKIDEKTKNNLVGTNNNVKPFKNNIDF